MADAYEEGQPMTTTTDGFLQKLDENPGGMVAIPFPGMNATVWITSAGMEDAYMVAVTCEGDEDHDRHIAAQYPLMSGSEVNDFLLMGRVFEFAAAADLN